MRTSVDKVREVIATSITDVQLLAFIKDASLWVDEELQTLATLSADRLELVERYLACALIRMRDLGLKAAKYDDINEQFQVDPETTEYLLRAAAFDQTGTVRKFFLASKDARTIAWRIAESFVDESAAE